jgi:hypothetical protein
MLLRVLMSFYEFNKIQLTCLEAKTSSNLPRNSSYRDDTRGVDHIGLAVICDLFDLAFKKVFLNFRAVDVVGRSRHPHDLAELVQRCFRMWSE